MTTGVNHITISVSNLQRSLEFYTRILGMRAVATWRVGAYLLAGSLWIALVEEKGIVRLPQEEHSHIALTVPPDSFRTASQLITEAGAVIWKDNTSEGDSLYFLDPDGHKLEIHASDLAARLAHMRVHPWDDIQYHDQEELDPA